MLPDAKTLGAAGMLPWSHRNCPAAPSGDRGHPGVEISIRRSRKMPVPARIVRGGYTDTPGLSPAISRAETVFWWRHNVLGCWIVPDCRNLSSGVIRLRIQECVKGALKVDVSPLMSDWHLWSCTVWVVRVLDVYTSSLTRHRRATSGCISQL